MKLQKDNSTQANNNSLWSLLRDDVLCVFERDPAARNKLEVLTTYPGVHAVLVYRLANRMWNRNWKYIARLLSYIARIWTSIDIHPGATIGRRFFIDHGAGVVIGETAEIGNNVTLYHGVTLGGTSWSQGKRHPTLEDDVVVGAGAKILGPIVIGRNAKVGANSVVINHVPEAKTIVGIPGKVVQSRIAENRNPYGVDLDHHLIPDPVSDAISCLMDRIGQLESELRAVRPVVTADDCNECAADCVDEKKSVGTALRKSA